MRVEQEVPRRCDGRETTPLPQGLCADSTDLGHDECSGPGLFAACGLDGQLQNARQSRQFVTMTLNRWALQPLVPDTELVVSELVTNAVQHALTHTAADAEDYPLWLGLFRHPRHLVCAVADPSPDPPRPRDPDALALGGRGLALIDALSDTWSWSPTLPYGKTIWVTLPLPSTFRPKPRPLHRRPA
ncbi:ATP-binding protein [Streptomyces sp. NPDC048479]|uniref:ATP-binding protein n=1 Tax=Streptomyces sp. NPDC048479 TaxID=3154725 RepID=UPI00342F0A16